MRMSRLSRIAMGVAALSLVAAACGGGGDDGGETSAPAPRSESTATSPGSDPSSAITVTSFDIGFRDEDLAAEAGEIDVAYVNDGAVLHTLVFEGLEDEFKLEVSEKGDRDSATIELEAGTYTYYCDVPGHRQAGMEGSLAVS